MKKKSILLSMTLAVILHAEQVTSIEYVNLTKISTTIANETLEIKVGEELDIKKVNNSIKKFYRFNYFDDILVASNNGKLQFIFKEKPSIANVDIIGYKSREDDIEALKKQIGISKGNLYSTKKIKKAKKALLEDLERAGYINSVVEVEIENINENSVSVTFNVNKGDEIIIKKVNYFGSNKLTRSDFESVTANKEEEFASWFITQNSGELNAEQLKYDNARIREVYLENGFMDAKVDNPFLEVDFASNQAELDFYIYEGKQYKVNKINIFINKDILNPEFFYDYLKLKEQKIFNIKKLRDDLEFIKTKIADLGYAFTRVKYDLKKDDKYGTVDVIYNILPGEKVYIRDVKISGNTRTLDRVIRRNVFLAPKDQFNLTDFNDSKNALKRSGFFENVVLEQKRVSENEMDLIVKVEEAPTGNIILGGGYGSYDGFMVNAALNEKNLFGSGLGLSVSADLSKRKSDLSIKLINPAIRDSKFNGFFDIHSNTIEINNEKYDLDKKVKGFSVGLGKELIRNLKVGATYRLDFIKEEYDYEDNFSFESDKNYYEDTDYVTSSVTPYINFDNTNDYFFPTDGIKVGTSLEFAGLGGDSEYLKSSSYFKYFYSLENNFDLDWVLRYKLQAKFLIDNGQINQGDSLYLGGTKTLRGYKSYAFGPDNEDGVIEDPYKSMASTSIEISFPLIAEAKMRWGVFYDYGMIGEDHLTDIKRSSTGALFEWISPFGPLQLIFAQPLDDEKGDDTSSFEFSLGQTF